MKPGNEAGAKPQARKKKAKGTKASKPSAVARRQRNLTINEYGSDLTGRMARKDLHVLKSSHGAFQSRADLKAGKRSRPEPTRTERKDMVAPKPRHRLRWDNPQPRVSLNKDGQNVNPVLYDFEMLCTEKRAA